MDSKIKELESSLSSPGAAWTYGVETSAPPQDRLQLDRLQSGERKRVRIALGIFTLSVVLLGAASVIDLRGNQAVLAACLVAPPST